MNETHKIYSWWGVCIKLQNGKTKEFVVRATSRGGAVDRALVAYDESKTEFHPETVSILSVDLLSSIPG